MIHSEIFWVHLSPQIIKCHDGRSPDRELTMTDTALKSSKCNLEESRDSYKVLHNHGLVYLFWEYLDIFRVCIIIYIHMHIPIFVHILHIFVDVPLADRDGH